MGKTTREFPYSKLSEEAKGRVIGCKDGKQRLSLTFFILGPKSDQVLKDIFENKEKYTLETRKKALSILDNRMENSKVKRLNNRIRIKDQYSTETIVN